MNNLSLRLVTIIFLLIITIHQLQYSFSSNHSIDSCRNSFYWLKPGVYFKYISYNYDAPNIILFDKMNNSIIVSDYLTIEWRVLNTTKKYMFIEYIVRINNARVFTENKLGLLNNNLIYTWNLAVDLSTLDTYIINENNNSIQWIGEWPYLINNIQSKTKSLKLLFIRSIGYKCILHKRYIRESELVSFLNKLNETIVNITIGNNVLKYIETDYGIELTSRYIGFVEINPPPNNYSFRLNNIKINKDRVVYARSYISLYIKNNYIEIFNTIYNISNRPLRFINLETAIRNYTIAIDQHGDIYCMIPPFITRVLYDNYSKVLLVIYGMMDNIIYTILGFKTISDTFISPYYPSMYERGFIELVDTNIDLTETVESRETELLNKWYIILIVSIIVSTITYVLIHAYLRAKRKVSEIQYLQ